MKGISNSKMIEGRRNWIRDELKHNASRLEISKRDERAHAAAIAISQLMMLRTISRQGPLTEADIQVAIDATMDGYRVDEYPSPMGACMFRCRWEIKPMPNGKKGETVRHELTVGDFVTLNDKEDAVVWEIVERDRLQLTIREAGTKNSVQYTDISLVAGYDKELVNV